MATCIGHLQVRLLHLISRCSFKCCQKSGKSGNSLQGAQVVLHYTDLHIGVTGSERSWNLSSCSHGPLCSSSTGSSQVLCSCSYIGSLVNEWDMKLLQSHTLQSTNVNWDTPFLPQTQSARLYIIMSLALGFMAAVYWVLQVLCSCSKHA